jgi:hypothetical protein
MTDASTRAPSLVGEETSGTECDRVRHAVDVELT